MLRIINLSRTELDIALLNNAINEDTTYILSFYEPPNTPVSIFLENNMEVINCIDFDSVRKFHLGKDISGTTLENFEINSHRLFSRKQAKKIFDIVKEKSKIYDNIIIQCETGKTLSASISAALDEYFNTNNYNFLDQKLYKDKYNISIYNTMISVLRND